MQEITKHTTVIKAATGSHGISSTGAVFKFAANFPYSEVITKNGYAIGYANHAFVLIIRTDGTTDARPIPMEKIGVRIHTASSQKHANIGIADAHIIPTSLKTKSGDSRKL